MPTLSVVMIVKNEAACLAECLGSVRGIADEVVIGDTGSTDETVAIAGDFSARVVSVPWRNDFAAARNAVLAEATGDWLLHLDADEVIDPDGARRLRALVDADGNGADAIELTLANYCDAPRAWRWVPCEAGSPYAKGYSGYIAVGLLRLFRNGQGYEYREAVHENITESVVERGGVIRAESVVIHHYGYKRDEKKVALYYAIAKEKVASRPGDLKAWRDLAEQAWAAGHIDEAADACGRILTSDPHHLDAVTMLGNIYLNAGNLEQARNLFQNLEAKRPLPPHIAVALAAVECRQGELAAARTRLESVVAADGRQVMARLYLARVLDQLGETAPAREHLVVAAATAPTIEEVMNRVQALDRRRQGEDLFHQGDYREALAAFVEALRCDDEDPLTQNDIGVVLTAMGQPQRAREAFERALKLAPAMAEARDNLNALQ